MTVQWDLLGGREFKAALDAATARVRTAQEMFVVEGAHVIEANAKRRAGEGGRHKLGTPTPATPGNGPAVITGNLRRSIHTRVTKSAFGVLGMVGPSAIYGRRVELEYGYPYMKPGLEDSRSEIQALARKWYRRALRG